MTIKDYVISFKKFQRLINIDIKYTHKNAEDLNDQAVGAIYKKIIRSAEKLSKQDSHFDLLKLLQGKGYFYKVVNSSDDSMPLTDRPSAPTANGIYFLHPDETVPLSMDETFHLADHSLIVIPGVDESSARQGTVEDLADVLDFIKGYLTKIAKSTGSAVNHYDRLKQNNSTKLNKIVGLE